MVLLLGYFAARRRVRATQATSLPSGVAEPPTQLRPWSSVHFDSAVLSLRAFASEYKNTFQDGQCSKRSALALHSLRDEAVGHMYQLRMRLPNDLDAEAQLTQHIEDTDRLLQRYIFDAQERCGEAMLHPGPLDDTYYRSHYRAHNDSVQ